MTKTRGPGQADSKRLRPEDWSRAALAAIADKGTANVSVERLARELGTTKGSFYWHFKDRMALIEAALHSWEVLYTDRIIERLSDVEDPRERFRLLLASAFDDQPGVLIDANLLAAADDPLVGPVLQRVARKRLDYVERIFAELGAEGGSDRALLAFSAYTGLAQLRRTASPLTPQGRRVKPYIDQVVEWLLGDSAG